MAIPNGGTTHLQSLLDQMQAGDADAKTQIIDHSCERLRNLTRKMLKNYPSLRRWEETDDVLQTALIRLHRSLSELQPENVRAYMGLAATQIRRTLIDLARHHFGPHGAGRHHHSDGVGAAADDPGQLIGTFEDGEPATIEAWSEFHNAVDCLPDEEREVFHLLWYEGITQIEAAPIVGVTERTIQRRWHSARCLLHASLRGDMPQ